jgi:hypothetical protein
VRPEYLQALEAARWNHWFLLMLVVPAILLCFATRSWTLGFVALPVACVLCWLFFFLAVEYYWDVKDRMALTPKEMEDATGDTARLYGPVLVEFPFAVIYCSLWWVVASVGNWIWKWTRRRAENIATTKNKPPG